MYSILKSGLVPLFLMTSLISTSRAADVGACYARLNPGTPDEKIVCYPSLMREDCSNFAKSSGGAVLYWHSEHPCSPDFSIFLRH